MDIFFIILCLSGGVLGQVWYLIVSIPAYFAILSCLCHAALWSHAGKGLTSWFSCNVCHFPIRYPGSGVVLDFIDYWYLPSSLLWHLIYVCIAFYSPFCDRKWLLILVYTGSNLGHYAYKVSRYCFM